MPKSPISAVVHTYNSELFLKECIESLQWCQEIVVVDMHSTDGTRQIAESLGARVYLHENLGYADPARQFGLGKCSNSWVLSVDSDEIIPDKLASKIQSFLGNPTADVVYLCFRNYFFGREIKGSGWSYKNLFVPRLFRKGALNYGHEVHNFIQIPENAKKDHWIDPELAIVHFNYLSVEHFISKLNRYTTLESHKLSRSPAPALSMGYQFLREFFGRWIILQGYKDGWVGLYLSFAMAFYRWSSIAKANLDAETENIKTYKRIADSLNNSTGRP